MSKKSQINFRSTAFIDDLLFVLCDKLDKNKTEILYAAIIDLAKKELSEQEFFECLERSLITNKI